ncbi:hypothetical protein GIB67_010080 [Kingdonia uniflora]|uniref:Conserved oligomeric Golgi complex subunit 1 n=1 Tax=Kingdonia uniflora TaxID=39325 RepID=A0A7J7PAR1_9MAGN|nr:hypothetical protein GIB67_010080 [Kingdonia uniflora]
MRVTPSRSLEDAEALFRSKPISQIRIIEASTKKEIEAKKEDLRQLIGYQYRDLINSADSIVLMKSSSESISSNISTIDSKIRSLSSTTTTGGGVVVDSGTPKLSGDPIRVKVYGIACRVKYLVDTPENIWGCLDESMFLEASGRYLRAKVVHGLVVVDRDRDLLLKFPLLQHQWQIVESFKGQISQRGRERLMDQDLGIGAYADALSAVAVIDELDPERVLELFLDSRKSWVLQKIGTCWNSNSDSSRVIMVLCDVVRVIQVSLGQVGEMFLRVLNDMPLFYKTILGSPPGSQLFGGLPNPDEEVRLWKLHRENLESLMVTLEKEFITKVCSDWLRNCGGEIISESNKSYLIDVIDRGEELASAERLIRESLDSRKVLERSLDWLKIVFGSEIDSPWNSVRGLVLNGDEDLWDGIFEDAFVQRMKAIIDLGFEDLGSVVNMRDSIRAIVASNVNQIAFQAYLSRVSTGGGVWFMEPNSRKSGENDFDSCLNAYFGLEVFRIRDAVDSRCRSVLDDLMCFLGSQKLASRLRELAPYVQNKCYESISAILGELEDELERLSVSLGKIKEDNTDSESPSNIVERSLFIGRLLFALRNHSSYIPKILGSPMSWLKNSMSMTNVADNLQSLIGNSIMTHDSPVRDSPRRQGLNSSKRQTSLGNAALSGVDDSASPKLELVSRNARDLCIRAHSLWISWISNELSATLSKHLESDDSLSVTTSLRVRMAIEEEEFRIKEQNSIDREGLKRGDDDFDDGDIETVLIRSMKNILTDYEAIGNPDDLEELLYQWLLEKSRRMERMKMLKTIRILRMGWEETEISKEIKFELPSMPSFYIISFLFQACEEIHRVGGHVLDKLILQKFALRLLERVLAIYGDFISIVEGRQPQVTDRGVLQILLDLRFTVDVLSGGDLKLNEDLPRNARSKLAIKHAQEQNQLNSANRKLFIGFLSSLSQRLDPIDWATYEPYLWENEKQAYLRHAVLFGFFVQLNRMYTDTTQKLPSNTQSNILRCSTVPRFKYLPISAPILSSLGTAKSTLSTSSDKISSSSSWKAYSNGELSQKLEFDDTSNFGVATPLLKSFMQVGESRVPPGISRANGDKLLTRITLVAKKRLIDILYIYENSSLLQSSIPSTKEERAQALQVALSFKLRNAITKMRNSFSIEKMKNVGGDGVTTQS